MATNSPIEWTDATWNPVTGCKHCYAEGLANRLHVMGNRNYQNGFELTLQPHLLDLPLKWKATKIWMGVVPALVRWSRIGCRPSGTVGRYA